MNEQTEIAKLRATITRLEVLERELNAPWADVCVLLCDTRAALHKAEIEDALLEKLGMKKPNEQKQVEC